MRYKGKQGKPRDGLLGFQDFPVRAKSRVISREIYRSLQSIICPTVSLGSQTDLFVLESICK